MVDPISAFGMATAAFNAIKKGFEVGRDVESMYGDIGRWMTSCETVNKEAKKAKTSGMSVEEEALEVFAHKKKIQAMEQELRTFVNMSHGPNAWNEVLRIQAEIRKKRKEAILAAKKKQEEMIMWTMIGVGSLCSLWVVFYVIWKAMGN
jgi:nitrogenase subunit NifH|tara:strand:+ start:3434 stop:3880 length:447 start_codon:yes stop_codon:yes gene_type:complete